MDGRTDRRSIEILAASPQYLAAILENADEAVVACSRRGRIALWNRAAERVFGWTAREQLGADVLDVVPEEQRAAALEWQERAMAGETVGPFEVERLHRDGRRVPVSVRVAPLPDHTGQVVGVVRLYRDLSALRAAEEARRRSDERFRALVENADEMMMILDLGDRITYASPAIARALGWDPERVVGDAFLSLCREEDRAEWTAALAGALADPSFRPRIEIRLRHADGGERRVEATIVDLVDVPEVGGVMVLARDVTERRALVEQLYQAQKMDALGRLAGGIAHDFNNLLTVIESNAEFLRTGLAGDPRAEDAEEIVRAARRGASLTQQLLGFTRRRPVEPRPIDVGRVVADMERMLGRMIGADVALEVRGDLDAGLVRADPGQIEQVLMNLAINAREALDGGGSVRIEVEGTSVDDSRPVKAGRYVRIRVTDDGRGMSPAVQQRIFEPFYTTKQRGTGLGLATVYGIVQQCRGWIGVSSVEGRGTTFEILLPVWSDAPAAARPRSSSPAPRGSETVLIVEDEAPVRAMMARVLGEAGYRVLVADGGSAALEIARERGGEIDLLLTDVIMPDMNGSELAERLVGRYPDLRVLFASGYAGDALGTDFASLPGISFLQKPFSPNTLAARVRALLDATAARV